VCSADPFGEAVLEPGVGGRGRRLGGSGRGWHGCGGWFPGLVGVLREPFRLRFSVPIFQDRVSGEGCGVPGGVDSGVAGVPAVPGLAPGACMRAGVISSRPRKRAEGRIAIRCGSACAKIEAPSASWGTATWAASATAAWTPRVRAQAVRGSTLRTRRGGSGAGHGAGWGGPARTRFVRVRPGSRPSGPAAESPCRRDAPRET